MDNYSPHLLLIGDVIANLFGSPQSRGIASTDILAVWKILLLEQIGYPIIVKLIGKEADNSYFESLKRAKYTKSV